MTSVPLTTSVLAPIPSIIPLVPTIPATFITPILVTTQAVQFTTPAPPQQSTEKLAYDTETSPTSPSPLIESPQEDMEETGSHSPTEDFQLFSDVVTRMARALGLQVEAPLKLARDPVFQIVNGKAVAPDVREEKAAEEKNRKKKSVKKMGEAEARKQKLLQVKSPFGNSNQVEPQKVKDMTSLKINPNDYGMDLNSDDSTDDENEPRKPIPVWANGLQLNEAVTYQYYNPPDITRLFGLILSPKLEDIFYKSKPRYFKRTSSAVWQSPPLPGTKPALRASNRMKKY
ncbi:hypothetical protein JD844_022066 [Phrynosoma platyrhinos]|uniref:Inner centromere protein ARK-binding domain-containing protein n=1 Tax=Phrynosoma platyrhinos TaxID=52577 RepID=A0ABQ7SUL9_PHRPL|nr:hypothetical protein JD844_022066 [Phrynosoma platyrhinos]